MTVFASLFSEKCVVLQFTIALVFYTKNVVFSANPESLSQFGSATYQTTGNECQVFASLLPEKHARAKKIEDHFRI